MTDEELAEIEARAAAATEGPWRWTEETSQWGPCGPDLRSTATTDPVEQLVVAGWGHDAWGLSVSAGDAAFIAAARTDVPRLVAEVRHLRAALEEQWWFNHHEHCTNRWPHPDGEPCYWRYPEVLGPPPASIPSAVEAVPRDAQPAETTR